MDWVLELAYKLIIYVYLVNVHFSRDVLTLGLWTKTSVRNKGGAGGARPPRYEGLMQNCSRDLGPLHVTICDSDPPPPPPKYLPISHTD